MEVAEQQQLPLPAAGALVHVQQLLMKLPGFRTEDPVSWFQLAEGQFTLRNVVDLVTHYFHVLASLFQDANLACLARAPQRNGARLLHNFHTCLLASYSLSNYQKM
jgi:hypothetical protein